MTIKSNIQSKLQRFQGFCGLRWQNFHAYNHIRLQLPSTRISNPTVNTFWARGYSTNRDIPSIESCPCGSDSSTPDLGSNEIDRKSPLAGAITFHYRHVLVHTGTIDWPKEIGDGSSVGSQPLGNREDENATSVTAKLKALVSMRSSYADPFYPILVTNTSLSTDPTAEDGHATITIFPDAVQLTSVQNSQESLQSVVAAFLVTHTSPFFSGQQGRDSFATRKISQPVILTCSHGNRDKRCGILGPAITKAFKQALDHNESEDTIDCIVGDISHIGGHKFAGNVIIHLPGDHPLSVAINKAPTSSRKFSFQVSESEELTEVLQPPDISNRSVSIWYGRVMPYHAEGIVDITIRKGQILKDLLRGIVNSDGNLVDLDRIGLK